MAEALKDWLPKARKTMKIGADHTTGTFLRDPFRPTFINSQHMLSPADGIILYQKIVKPTEKIVEVKGRNYTIQEIMQDWEFKEESLVVGVFMTYADVHVNRAPYGGHLWFEEKPPILSNNLPMVHFEDGLLDGLVSWSSADYLFANSRVVNYFYVPMLNWRYYLVQIADKEVNVTMHFNSEQGEFIPQGERFSIVRWGSQVDLILPVNKNFSWETIHPDQTHVEAGSDKLLKLKYKR